MTQGILPEQQLAFTGLTDTELRASPVPVSLDAATLTALETINAIISDGGGSITVDDGGTTLTVDGTVALDAGTLSALETITAVISGAVALDSGTLTALETTELGSTTLAALENIVVSGTVELGSTTLSALETGIADQGAAAADTAPWPVKSGVPTAATGAITASGTGQRVSMACAGYSGATILYSGTYSGGIMVFEYSLDGGSTYLSTTATFVSGGVTALGIETTGRTLTANVTEAWMVTLPPGATHVATYSIVGPTSGSLAVRITVGAFKGSNATQARTWGDVEHDAANTGGTVQVGGHASATPPSAVASADRVRAWLTLYGAQMVAHETLATAAVTNVAASASSVQLLAANTARKGLVIHNGGTGILYVKYGTTATATTSFTVRLATDTGYTATQPVYNGRVDGIWSATGGNGAVITEIT